MTDRTASTPIAYADSNLFVSLFADATHPLHEQAVNLFRRVAEGRLVLIVTSVVVAELFYVASAALGWSRAATARHIAGLLEADGLVVPEADVLSRACELFAGDSHLDFADAYLAALGLQVGPSAVASFDRDFDRVAGVSRISS